MRLRTQRGRVRKRIARVGSPVSLRGFPPWETPPGLALVSGHDGGIPLICTEWSIHPVWLGIEPPNRVPHASGFASVISNTLKYRPSILSKQKLSQNLFKIISHAVAHKLLRCRSDPSTIPPGEASMPFFTHSYRRFHQHSVIRCVPTQPELHGER